MRLTSRLTFRLTSKSGKFEGFGRQMCRWEKQERFSRVLRENCIRSRVERPLFSSVSLDFGDGDSSRTASKMDFFRYFSAVPFDHVFERKLRFSAANSKSGVASFRTKVLFFWLFCAPEIANPLLGSGKKSPLSPTVELLASSAQTTPFLIKIWEKSPNSVAPKSQLF